MLNFQELIDTEIAESEKEREQNHWFASSLGNCPTGQYYSRQGVEPDQPFTPRIKRIFNVGNIFEGWLLDLLKRKGGLFQIEQQKELGNKGLDVSGHPDAIITQADATKEILELKTIHSRGFWHLKKEGKNGYDHHRQQLWLYLYLEKVDRGRIIYISKDDLSIAEYPVFLNDTNLKREAFDTLKILNEAWKKQVPPKPITDPLDWRYQRCQWHLQCLESAGIKEWGIVYRGAISRYIPLEDRKKQLKEKE